MSAKTGTLYWLPKILADESLDPVETLLLVGLADHVNGDDECFAGIATLAKYARTSYATARRRLTGLEARGRIIRTRKRRDDGNLSVYVYRLVRDGQALNLSDDQRAPGSHMTSAHPEERAEPPHEEPPRTEDPPTPHPVVADPVPDEFDRWYGLYPSKVGKIEARKAFAKARRLVGFDVLIAGVERYRLSQRVADGVIANPATWLNRGGWDDELPAARSTSGPKVSKSTQSLADWARRAEATPTRRIG